MDQLYASVSGAVLDSPTELRRVKNSVLLRVKLHSLGEDLLQKLAKAIEKAYLEAKLGYGTTSSVWLAKDLLHDRYVAAKVLTGHATLLNLEDKLQELKVLKRLASPPVGKPSEYCNRLLESFYQKGVDYEDGAHLCLFLELSGSDVQTIRRGYPDYGFLPLPIVKRILRDVLRGIADLHACGIVHTYIKPDNIMAELGSSWTTEAIDAWLREHPPQAYPPIQSIDKMVTVTKRQSLPQPSLDELASVGFKLADFSSAQFVREQTTDDITPLGLRPPEIMLGCEWDESVDIWTYGCLVFNILTNRPLFGISKPEAAEIEEDVLLYQMISFCGEFFKPEFLKKAPRSTDYFNLNCKLKKFDKYARKPFEQCIKDSGFPFSDEEISAAAAFMSKCLRLDPRDRLTAKELLCDSWLEA